MNSLLIQSLRARYIPVAEAACYFDNMGWLHTKLITDQKFISHQLIDLTMLL